MTQTIDTGLFDQQFDALTATEKKLAVVGGIGSGKTRVGSERALAASQGSIGGIAVPTPNMGVVTAPTYPMLRDATIATFLEVAAPFIPRGGYNKSEHVVTMRNGSVILFRSADNPEHLRGPNALWWWGDEAALYGDKVLKIMAGRLRQHGRLGWYWLTTSPKGRNWIWQRFIQRATADTRIIKIPTWANPFIDEEFYLSLVEEYVGDFARQELDGEFVAFEGLIYSTFDRARHMAEIQPDQVQRLSTVDAGVDWGFNHPGVITVGGKNGDGKFFELHEEYQRKRLIEDWVGVAVQLRDNWGIRRFHCDPSQPEFIQKFVEAGLDAVAANNAVIPGIQQVNNLLELRPDGRGGYTTNFQMSPSCVHSASEFEQYQWASNKNGTLEKPLKSGDDTKDAERYLVMGLYDAAPQWNIGVDASRYA